MDSAVAAGYQSLEKHRETGIADEERDAVALTEGECLLHSPAILHLGMVKKREEKKVVMKIAAVAFAPW